MAAFPSRVITIRSGFSNSFGPWPFFAEGVDEFAGFIENPYFDVRPIQGPDVLLVIDPDRAQAGEEVAVVFFFLPDGQLLDEPQARGPAGPGNGIDRIADDRDSVLILNFLGRG